jgi:hypothetical protein
MDGLRTDGYARKREQEVRKIMQRTYQECEMCELTPQEILAYIEDMAQGNEDGEDGYAQIGNYGFNFNGGLSREEVISDKELVNLCAIIHKMDLEADGIQHHLTNAGFDYRNPLHAPTNDDIQWIGILGSMLLDARNEFMAILSTHIEQGEPL